MKREDREGVTVPEPNQLAIALLQFLCGLQRGLRWGRDTRKAACAEIRAGADGDVDSGRGRQVGTKSQLLDLFWM